MSDPGVHISTWEQAGLIDAATAARLRAADTPTTEPQASQPTGRPTGAAEAVAMFGPSVTIPEVFGYLGTAFLLAGWTTFVTRTGSDESLGTLGLGALVASIVLVGLGAFLRRGDARRRRGAGVAFLVAVGYAAAGVASLLASARVEGPQVSVLATAVALALALVLRVVQPSVLTQIGLLGALSVFAASMLDLFHETVFGEEQAFSAEGLPLSGGPDPLIQLVLSTVWWLVWAVVIGVIGLREARHGLQDTADAARRRAAISRFWAGVMAVVGVATAVTRSATDASGEFRRVLDPWMAELAIIVVAVVLLERAFRRDATSYVYAAALGLIIALSDFNFTYLSDTAEIGLVIEGAILLAVGIAADRLRRRIGGIPGPEAGPTPAAEPASGP